MSVLSNCGTSSRNVGLIFDVVAKRASRYAGLAMMVAIVCIAVSSSVLANSANSRTQLGSARSNITLPVLVTAPTMTTPTISTFVVPISVNDITGENIIAFQFNILYDPAVINPFGPNFGCSTTGTIAGAAGLGPTCNVVMGDAGRLRISVSGANAMNGIGPVLNLTFKTVTGAMSGDFSPVTFEPGTLFFFRGGPMAGPVPVTATNGQVDLIGPSASLASISGKVATSSGRGVQNAIVTVSGGGLVTPRIARTGGFGYFTIEDLQAGETYVVTVNSKRFVFAAPSRVITLADSVDGIDFIADPE